MSARLYRLSLLAVSLLLPAGAFAQAQQTPSAYGSQYMRLFDPKTVTTVTGTVVSVDHVNMQLPPGAQGRGMHPGGMHGKGMHPAVHARLKTAQGEFIVHLGPAWFVDNQDVQLKAGAQVEVKGSKVTVNGHPTLIAMEIHRGSDVLTLRDAQGVPVWVAWKQR